MCLNVFSCIYRLTFLMHWQCKVLYHVNKLESESMRDREEIGLCCWQETKDEGTFLFLCLFLFWSVTSLWVVCERQVKGRDLNIKLCWVLWGCGRGSQVNPAGRNTMLTHFSHAPLRNMQKQANHHRRKLKWQPITNGLKRPQPTSSLKQCGELQKRFFSILLILIV